MNLINDQIRCWETVDGGSAEAVLVSDPADPVVRLKSPDGKMIKISFWRLSQADRTYLSEIQTPRLRLDVGKNQKNVSGNQDRYICKARIYRKSGPCALDLTAHLYVISENTNGRDANKVERELILPFQLYEEKEFNMTAEPVILSHNRGRAWKGYLLVVAGPDGEPIGHRTTHEWLFDQWVKRGGNLEGYLYPESDPDNSYKRMRFE